MEIREAIDILREKVEHFESDYTEKTINYWSALKLAVSALEKQIAKTPDYEGDGYSDGQLVYDTWICPNCGNNYEVGYDDDDYCPKCGQHIQHLINQLD